MKILHLCPYLYPAVNFGGPAEVVYQLALQQSKKNQVTVATSDAFSIKKRISETDKLKSNSNFSVLYFKNIWNKSAFTIRFFTHFGLILWVSININKFNVIHIHDVFIIPQLISIVIAKINSVPVVFSPHGVLDPTRLQEKSLIKKIFLKVLVIPALNTSQAIIATSKNEAESLSKITKTRIEVVENGIFYPKISKKAEKNPLRFSYLGRLHKQKGLIELVEAIYKIPKNKRNVELIIAGPDDGLSNLLKKTISALNLDNIIKLEVAKNADEKWHFLANCDVFIYPSYAEGFSISILEAMSLSLPVIITEGCNFSKVESENAGLIIPTRKLSNNLANAIIKMASSEEMRKQMGKNANKLIRSQYSISRMAHQVKNVYKYV